MVHFNEETNELAVKIVYYGPAHSGKTQNLQYIHQKLAPYAKTELISLETETSRTLYFDLLPVKMGDFQGTNVRLLLYTVPGQKFYHQARKLVLQSADAIIFVVDSDKERLLENRECYQSMIADLKSDGRRIRDILLAFQYNKRDLPCRLPVDILNGELNHIKAPYYEATAISGEGVIETLKELSKLLFNNLASISEEYFKIKNRRAV
ncbi:GTPase domain-containing protein [bacterium]|nr:GTPase domain-containing protein [bacterium]